MNKIRLIIKKGQSLAGFAGVEIIMLITILVGIGAATRLALENQNLQKLAAPNSCYYKCMNKGGSTSKCKSECGSPEYNPSKIGKYCSRTCLGNHYCEPDEKGGHCVIDIPVNKPQEKPYVDPCEGRGRNQDGECKKKPGGGNGNGPVDVVLPPANPVASPTVSPTPMYFGMPCSANSKDGRCIASGSATPIAFGDKCRTDLDLNPGDTPLNSICINPNSILDSVDLNPLCICASPTPVLPTQPPQPPGNGNEQALGGDENLPVISGEVVINDFSNVNIGELMDNLKIDLHELQNPNPEPLYTIVIENTEFTDGKTTFFFDKLVEGSDYKVSASAYRNNAKLNYPERPDLIQMKVVDPAGNGTVCQSACELIPGEDNTVVVELNFPVSETASLTGQGVNNAIMSVLGQWFSGLIDRINLFNFFRDLPDAPGLKKGSCNPAAGGCKAVY